MKRIFLLPLLAVSLFLPQIQAIGLKDYKGDATPSLSLSDLSGKMHTLEDYAGKVVMVQFWATYCPPCRKEMPSMNRLMQKLGEDRFKILAINMGETKDQVQAFVDEVKPDFSILLDSRGESIQAWKVYAATATFIVDPAGKIRYTLFGGIEWDSEEIVKKLDSLALK